MPKMILLLFIVFLFVIAFTNKELHNISQQFRSDNYCYNELDNANWKRMIKKHPDDLELFELYALRKELCQAIEDGDRHV